MKPLLKIFPLIISGFATFLLASCGVTKQASATVMPFAGRTPASTINVSATLASPPSSTATPLHTATPTRTVFPTARSTATTKSEPTVTPTSSLEPSLIWGDWLGKPIVLEDFYGSWSPTADELVGIQGTAVYTGNLVLSSAPDFIMNPYLFEKAGQVWYRVTWSPDGKSILFGIPTNKGGDIPIDTSSELWAIQRGGSNLRQLPGSYNGLDFPAWLDKRTVVVTNYVGGGHEVVSEIDYISGKILVQDLLHVLYMGKPQGEYLPVVSGEAEITTHILTKYLQNQSPYCPDENCYTLEFPLQKINNPDRFDTYFEDWQPGKQAALISVEGFKPVSGIRLFLWDIKTDSLTTMIPGGMNARFSPDGQSLLFTTIGASSNYTSSISGPLTLDPVPTKGTIYLQLMNIQDRQVIMSLPIMTWAEFRDYPREYFDTAQYSPDGHYLAFRSLGAVETDEKGWPSGVSASDTGQINLNIVDLRDKKLLYSAPNPEQWLELVWAPKGDKLVHHDSLDNWLLVDLSTMEVLPITVSGGQQVDEAPEWSFDGRYLSVTTRLPNYMYDSSMTRTYIFDLLQP